MKDIYRLSPDARYFCRDTIEPFNYSDGSEEEQRLHDIMLSAQDVSTFSDDLLRSITDWPSEYHLTRARHCLVRPLGIKPGDTVLELGCGCGAITRYLGELGAHVTAVEGSAARAGIAAERCRDLDNVRIVVDDLLRFETDNSYDWVTLIGVLEYAPMYADPADPVLSYLASATRYLAAHGRLVVAIENRLGMKYFNACAEDHLGVPFLGVQNLYKSDGPRTFGKRELAAQLARAGLSHQNFLYPWPDYKLPSVILSDAALNHPDLLAYDMLARSHARDYSGNELRLFDDALVIASVAKNGLLGDLSNSFLTIASRQPLAECDRVVAVSYGVRQRQARFCTETNITVTDNNPIVVNKNWLTENEEGRLIELSDGLSVSQQVGEEPYIKGSSLLWTLYKSNGSGSGLDSTVHALLPWFDHLLSRSRPTVRQGNDLANFKIGGEYLDCNPANLLVTDSGLIDIDQEWCVSQAVDLGWVLCRGVTASLSKGLSLASKRSSVADVVIGLCSARALVANNAQMLNWMRLEADLQESITGIRPNFEISAPMGTKMTPVFEGIKSLLTKHQVGLKVERHNNAISLLDRELNRYKSLRSSLTKNQLALADSIHKRKMDNARSVRYRDHLDDSNKRIRHYQERINRLDRLIESQRKKIAARDKQIASRDKQIASRDKQIASRDKQIEALMRTLPMRFALKSRRLWQLVRRKSA